MIINNLSSRVRGVGGRSNDGAGRGNAKTKVLPYSPGRNAPSTEYGVPGIPLFSLPAYEVASYKPGLCNKEPDSQLRTESSARTNPLYDLTPFIDQLTFIMYGVGNIKMVNMANIANTVNTAHTEDTLT